VRLIFDDNTSPYVVASWPFEVIRSGVPISCEGMRMNVKSKMIAVAPTTPPTINPDFAKCLQPLFFIYKPFYTLIDF